MVNWSPYQQEQIVLAQPLKFGSQAALAVLPALTPDKFIYGLGGNLGGTDHRDIWAKIEHVALREQTDPYVGNILPHFTSNTEIHAYLLALVNMLDNMYSIFSFGFKGYRKHAREVFENGRKYKVGLVAQKYGRIAIPENFPKMAKKIHNTDQWVGSMLSEFRDVSAGGEEVGYQPITVSAEQAISQLNRQLAGEQVVLLPVGMSCLINHGLLPSPVFAVIHGGTGGGKSTLAQNVFCLGTAMGLVANRVKGCVGINTLEMNGIKVINRMAASLAGFNTFTLLSSPEKLNKEDVDRFKYYLEFVGKLPIVIDPSTRIGPEDLNYRANVLHLGERGPIRLLNTDYLELFQPPAGTSKQREESILAEIVAEHFLLSQDLNTTVLAVSQSNYSSNTWVAGLHGMRGSRAISHKARIVMEVINYNALEKAGESYKIAKGLDNTHLWLRIEKYEGGPTNADIPFGWNPEHNQVYDDTKDDWMDVGNSVLFDHLAEVEKLLREHPTTKVIPIEDTPLAELPMNGQKNDWDWEEENQHEF